MKIQKRLILPLCLALTCSVGFFVQAKHHQLIHPGDHVFDAKRFHDSVLETAQQALTASQTAQELTIRILQHTGIVEPGSAVAQAMDRYENRYDGQTMVSPNVDMTSTPAWWDISYEQDYASMEPEKKMSAYLNQVHSDAAGVEQDVMRQQSARMKDMQDIAAIEAPGRMGEIQKGSSLAILRGMDTADEARLAGAQMASSVADSQTRINEEVVDRFRTSLKAIETVDPYQPDKIDEENMPAIDNFGFISTQDIE